MSEEYFVLNTEDEQYKPSLELKPLNLVDETNSCLYQVLPEYDVSKLPNSSMKDLVTRMKMTMKLYNGIGLSANQCGINIRMFILGTDDIYMACINPIITGYGGVEKRMREGCLSYPGMTLSIPRYESIDVQFYDENGNKKTPTLSGLTAQCFQHELDHMNGITFTSKVGPVALQLARKKQNKLFKKAKRVGGFV